MDSNRMSNASAAVAGQMTLVFVVLKIAEQIDWGWLWVLTPLWLYSALTIGVGIVIGIAKGLSNRGTIRL